MATLEGIASVVQLLQSEMETVKTRIVAAETLAQARADILDNYVDAAATIHKSIDAQGTRISDAVSTQIRDGATLRKHWARLGSVLKQPGTCMAQLRRSSAAYLKQL